MSALGKALSANDVAAYIRTHLEFAPVPGLDGISMYRAQPSSGLWRLSEQREGGFGAPYWAYQWAGGLALAHYFQERPETVRGRRVLDLGAGGGVVSIAAMRAGAAEAIGAEIDPVGVEALRLNAEANGVAVTLVDTDLTGGEPPEADVVTVGDLFYEADTANSVLPFLDRCLARGMTVLVGDPGRKHLPHPRLRPLAQYEVSDFGRLRETGKVFAFAAGGDPAMEACA